MPVTAVNDGRRSLPAARTPLDRGRRRDRPRGRLRRHAAAQPRAARLRRRALGRQPEARADPRRQLRSDAERPPPPRRRRRRRRPGRRPSPTRSTTPSRSAAAAPSSSRPGFGEVEIGPRARGPPGRDRPRRLVPGLRAERQRHRQLPGPRGALGRLGPGAAGGRRRDDLAERQRRRQRARLAARDRLPHGRSRPATRRSATPATGSARCARADGVRSIAMFLESDGDGERLAAALADCAERGIGVVVLKVGSSEAGAGAAAAHTGSLAGDQRVFRALIEEAGACWAREPHELLELARVLAEPRARPDRSGGVAFLTCSGGDSGIAADEADRVGLDPAPARRGDPRAPRRAPARGRDDRQPARLHVADLGRARAPRRDRRGRRRRPRDRPDGDLPRHARGALGRDRAGLAGDPRRARRRRRALGRGPALRLHPPRPDRRRRSSASSPIAGSRRSAACTPPSAAPPSCGARPAIRSGSATISAAAARRRPRRRRRLALGGRGQGAPRRRRHPGPGRGGPRPTRRRRPRPRPSSAGPSPLKLSSPRDPAQERRRRDRARARRARPRPRGGERGSWRCRSPPAPSCWSSGWRAPGVELLVAARADAVVPALVVGSAGSGPRRSTTSRSSRCPPSPGPRRDGAPRAARRGAPDRRARRRAGRRRRRRGGGLGEPASCCWPRAWRCSS